MIYLGIDTSNYTTSAALYDSDNNTVLQEKELLPVKKGERGLRQSDAVFHHTQQLPEIINDLFSQSEKRKIDAIGVSDRPRSINGSYMPCFTVGICTAQCISSVTGAPVHRFSHQQGHIIAALFSCGRLDLINSSFIAFHVSGGTTEALLVTPDEENIINCEIIASSTDLKAGQAIDRVGVMLGLKFPCGAEMDRLSLLSDKKYKIKTSVTDSGNCSLSGIENKCYKKIQDGEQACDIARFCIESVSSNLEAMTDKLLIKYGNLPLIFAGGVMSNSLIKQRFTAKYGAYFAESRFSSDNAAGIAVLAYLKEKNNGHNSQCQSD